MCIPVVVATAQNSSVNRYFPQLYHGEHTSWHQGCSLGLDVLVSRPSQDPWKSQSRLR